MMGFGQSFLNSLANPSYGQGMFNLGQSVGSAPALYKEQQRRKGLIDEMLGASDLQKGMIMEREGRATGDMEMALGGQAAQEKVLASGANQGINALLTQISDPKTSEQIVQSSIQTARQLARNNKVDEYSINSKIEAALKARQEKNSQAMASNEERLKTLIQMSQDPEEMRRLNAQLLSVAKEPSKYVDYWQSVIDGRNEDLWKRIDNQSKIDEKVNQNLVNYAVGQMISSGSTEVPSSITIGDQRREIGPALFSLIKKTYTERKKIDEDFDATLVEDQPLEPEYAERIIALAEESPELIGNNTSLNAAVKTVTGGKVKPSSPVYKAAVKEIKKVVDGIEANERKAATSDYQIRQKVIRMINAEQGKEDRVVNLPWQDSLTMLDIISDPDYNDIKEQFIDNAIQELKADKGLSWRELTDRAMTGMEKFIPEEHLQRAREDIAAENQQLLSSSRESAINFLMESEGINRDQAEMRLKNLERNTAKGLSPSFM